MRENADQNNHYGNVQSSKNLMRQSKEIGQYQNILISASAQFLAAMKSFISGMGKVVIHHALLYLFRNKTILKCGVP